jgi:putative transcriptional regulator
LKNRIKELREKKGLSQASLAKILNISRQSIISIEKGKYNPSLELAFLIADTFNCSIEDLFIREEINRHE